MIPPKGFKAEVYPLYHKQKYSFGLSAFSGAQNSTMAYLIRHTSDIDLQPKVIEVNPHNTNYQEDNGGVVQKMSLIKNFKSSIKFNFTENASVTDKPNLIKFFWRPIFFSFGEKLDAADDDTGTTVKAILHLLKDATFADITSLFDNGKLPTVGTSDLLQPVSTVNQTEAVVDLNMDVSLGMETVAWDEELFQNAIRRYTNKGALRACVGKTRYVTLSTHKPNVSFNLSGVPRALKRIVDYAFMAILVHIPLSIDIGQAYQAIALTDSVAHIGCKIITTYEEWNSDHYQDMTGTG